WPSAGQSAARIGRFVPGERRAVLDSAEGTTGFVNRRERRHLMKACCWYGKNDVRVETVPDPKIKNPRDAIIKVNLAAICGSDLHLLHGAVPSMESGDILGHEFMGEVMEVGAGNHTLQR